MLYRYSGKLTSQAAPVRPDLDDPQNAALREAIADVAEQPEKPTRGRQSVLSEGAPRQDLRDSFGAGGGGGDYNLS